VSLVFSQKAMVTSADILLAECPGCQNRIACPSPVFWSNRTPHAQRRGPHPHQPLTRLPSRNAPLSPRPLQRVVRHGIPLDMVLAYVLRTRLKFCRVGTQILPYL